MLTDLIVKINGSSEQFTTFENTDSIPFALTAVTSTRSFNVSSGYEFKCISNDNVTIRNSRISIGSISEDAFITFLASYTLHGTTIQKYATIYVKANKMLKMNVVGAFEVSENSTYSYRVTADFANGQNNVDITDLCSIKLAYGPSDAATVVPENPIRIRYNAIDEANKNVAFIAEESSTRKDESICSEDFKVRESL